MTVDMIEKVYRLFKGNLRRDYFNSANVTGFGRNTDFGLNHFSKIEKKKKQLILNNLFFFFFFPRSHFGDHLTPMGKQQQG